MRSALATLALSIATLGSQVLDARARELSGAINRVRAQKNPIGLASGFDQSGREVVFVAQKQGQLDEDVARLLKQNEVPVTTAGVEDAEIQAAQAARLAGLDNVMVAARPNLVCVECEAYMRSTSVAIYVIPAPRQAQIQAVAGLPPGIPITAIQP
jgi:hypothetical protein